MKNRISLFRSLLLVSMLTLISHNKIQACNIEPTRIVAAVFVGAATNGALKVILSPYITELMSFRNQAKAGLRKFLRQDQYTFDELNPKETAQFIENVLIPCTSVIIGTIVYCSI